MNLTSVVMEFHMRMRIVNMEGIAAVYAVGTAAVMASCTDVVKHQGGEKKRC